ncbi:hypothetical protein MMC08_005293 [Hypocenomyce scalaris]|nr:hypothetical protein [Hypocenomyce scalaris]
MTTDPPGPPSEATEVPPPSEATSVPNGAAKGAVVCVFCGSSAGTSPAHTAAARALAASFHSHSITLIYGGGTVGLMGELARTLVALSGPRAVHGIIPEALIKYEQSTSSSSATTTDEGGANNAVIDETLYGRTTVVPDMHTRKQLMTKEVMEGGPGSGFVALSGGYGTLEELMEVVTWNQLGIHGRGIVVLNVEGYYDGLIQWVRTAVAAGFIGMGNAGILVEALDAEEVVRELREYRVAEGRFQLDWTQK